MSNISVDYDVLNQRGSPAWFTDTFANIPTAGFVGRMFISTDTFAFYRDTGSGWDLIGGPGIGTLTGSGASGQVSFFNGTQTITGNNNLFWDNTNGRLGIGTATPGAALDIHSTGTNAQFNGTGTNNAYIVFQNAGTSKWRIGNTYNAGANSFDIYNNGLTNTPFSISSTTNAITLASNVTTTGAQFVQNALYVGYANAGATALYTNIYGSANGINFGLANGTGGANFIFQTAAGYNYTFPATTGTLALTSNLSSYVPYTGATTDVNLGIYGLTLGNNLAINGNNSSQGGFLGFKQFATTQNGLTGYTSFSALNTNILYLLYSTGSSTTKYVQFDSTNITNNSGVTLSFPNSSGTFALTSDLSSYLPLTGGTLTGGLIINPTNTAIVGLDVASNTTRFRSDNLEGFKRQLEITMSSGTVVNITAKGYLANYGTDMAFYTATTSGTNGTPAMYITGTNNRIGIKTGLPAYDLDVAGDFRSTTTSYLATTSGNIGIGSTTIYNGGGFGKVISFYDATSLALTYVTNTQQYQVGIASTDYRIYDFTGSTYRLAIKGSTGNVIIDGTTDNGQKLQVNGTVNIQGMTISSANVVFSNSVTNIIGTVGRAMYFVTWYNTSSGAQGGAVCMANASTGLTIISIADGSGCTVTLTYSGGFLKGQTIAGTVNLSAMSYGV